MSTSMLKIGVSDYAVRQHEPGSLLPLTAATAARYWQRKDWLNSPVPQVHTICAPLTIVSSPAPDTAYEKAAAAPAERLGDDQRPGVSIAVRPKPSPKRSALIRCGAHLSSAGIGR